jgi:hypothetical protein
VVTLGVVKLYFTGSIFHVTLMKYGYLPTLTSNGTPYDENQENSWAAESRMKCT